MLAEVKNTERAQLRRMRRTKSSLQIFLLIGFSRPEILSASLWLLQLSLPLVSLLPFLSSLKDHYAILPVDRYNKVISTRRENVSLIAPVLHEVNLKLKSVTLKLAGCIFSLKCTSA